MKAHKPGADAGAPAGEGDDQQSQPVKLAQRRRAQDRAADAYNRARPQIIAQFNQLTGGSCADGDGVDVKRLREWQKAHGLEPDGKLGKATLEAARQGKDEFEGEGVAEDGPTLENPAFEDNLTGGMEHKKSGGDDDLERAGDAVGQANEGSGLTGGPESPWLKAAMAPAILEMLREGRYGDALWTLAHQFSPSEALEGLTMACEKLGLHRILPILEQAAPYVAGASAGLELVLWSYEGLKAIGEAHEAGDRDSRIVMYAQAFAACFLEGESAGENPGAVTDEQREAVEAGRRDGAATAGKTGELAPIVGQWLLEKHGSEGNARRAIIDELLQRAGFSGVRTHS